MSIFPNTATSNVTIGRDTTLRWSFRSGDFLLWVRVPGWFSEPSPEILDFWELHDGHHALLTNRYQDIPTWFELHPTEVCNTEAYRMMERLNSGYVPQEPMDGPNIWRVMVSDWLLWVGPARGRGYSS